MFFIIQTNAEIECVGSYESEKGFSLSEVFLTKDGEKKVGLKAIFWG